MPVVSGGGGGPAGVSAATVIQTGSVDPVGVVVPARVGALYQDLASGALYQASGATSADWVAIGGNTDTAVIGISAVGSVKATADTALNGAVVLGDTAAVNGTGNALQWSSNGADGTQTLRIFLGSTGQFTHTFAANGAYTNANGIIFPSANPHIVGAWWDNAGTLTRSAG